MLEIARRFGRRGTLQDEVDSTDVVSSAVSDLHKLSTTLEQAAIVLMNCSDEEAADAKDSEKDREATKSKSSSMESWCLSVLDDWAHRIQTLPGARLNSRSSVSFKTIDNRPSTQIRTVLGTGKHLEKSRKVRGKLELLGSGNDEEAVEGSSIRHYDDGDIYRALLREVIESGDAPGGGLQFARLARSGRVRKIVDRKASKGRKLRYVTHEKLVGFLAPAPMPDPGPVDQILASLFGGHPN